LLSTYTWYLNDAVDGKIHLDYREERGAGGGPDLNLHLGQWGERSLSITICTTKDQPPARNGTPWVDGIPEKPPARLFRLPGDPGHQFEREGARELPERSALAA